LSSRVDYRTRKFSFKSRSAERSAVGLALLKKISHLPSPADGKAPSSQKEISGIEKQYSIVLCYNKKQDYFPTHMLMIHRQIPMPITIVPDVFPAELARNFQGGTN
jgi:hypothetical protein